MKCPKCGKELLIRDEKVAVGENGTPVFNQFAVCMDCKKKWNLDKQRSKKTAEKKADENTAQKPVSEKEPASSAPVSGIAAHKKAVEQAKAAAPAKPVDAAVKSSVKKASIPESRQTGKVLPADAEVKPVIKKAGTTPEARPFPKKTLADLDLDTEDTRTAVDPQAKPAVKRAAAPNGKPTVRKAPANPDGRPMPRKAPVDPENRPVKKKAPVNPDVKASKKKVPADTDGRAALKKTSSETDVKPVSKKAPVKQQTYSNIPAKEIRDKREEEMRRGYDELLSTGDDDEPKHSKIPVIIMSILIILALAAAGTIFFCKATGRDIPFISLSQTEASTSETMYASAEDIITEMGYGSDTAILADGIAENV